MTDQTPNWLNAQSLGTNSGIVQTGPTAKRGFDACALHPKPCTLLKLPNVGTLISTYAIFGGGGRVGVPYYSYSIIYPKTLF